MNAGTVGRAFSLSPSPALPLPSVFLFFQSCLFFSFFFFLLSPLFFKLGQEGSDAAYWSLHSKSCLSGFRFIGSVKHFHILNWDRISLKVGLCLHWTGVRCNARALGCWRFLYLLVLCFTFFCGLFLCDLQLSLSFSLYLSSSVSLPLLATFSPFIFGSHSPSLSQISSLFLLLCSLSLSCLGGGDGGGGGCCRPCCNC